MEAKHAAPLHNVYYSFSCCLLRVWYFQAFPVKACVFVGESSGDLFAYPTLCADVNGTSSGKDQMASRPVFHWFTIRSALPKRLKAWSYLIWGRTNSCSDISPAGAGSHLSLVAVPCILGSFGENTHWKSKHSDSCRLFWLLFQWPWRDMVILSISGCLLCNAL